MIGLLYDVSVGFLRHECYVPLSTRLQPSSICTSSLTPHEPSFSLRLNWGCRSSSSSSRERVLLVLSVVIAVLWSLAVWLDRLNQPRLRACELLASVSSLAEDAPGTRVECSLLAILSAAEGGL